MLHLPCVLEDVGKLVLYTTTTGQRLRLSYSTTRSLLTDPLPWSVWLRASPEREREQGPGGNINQPNKLHESLYMLVPTALVRDRLLSKRETHPHNIHKDD